jgi:hypothetical protein
MIWYFLISFDNKTIKINGNMECKKTYLLCSYIEITNNNNRRSTLLTRHRRTTLRSLCSCRMPIMLRVGFNLLKMCNRFRPRLIRPMWSMYKPILFIMCIWKISMYIMFTILWCRWVIRLFTMRRSKLLLVFS